MVQILVSDREAGKARDWSSAVGRALREEGGRGLIVAGPGPAPVERLKDRHRQQILVRSAGKRRLVEVVQRALQAVEGIVPQRALTVDVDPRSLL
jgi:primosomal protein N'